MPTATRSSLRTVLLMFFSDMMSLYVAQYEPEIYHNRDQGQQQGKAHICLAAAADEFAFIVVGFPVHAYLS